MSVSNKFVNSAQNIPKLWRMKSTVNKTTLGIKSKLKMALKRYTHLI